MRLCHNFTCLPAAGHALGRFSLASDVTRVDPVTIPDRESAEVKINKVNTPS